MHWLKYIFDVNKNRTEVNLARFVFSSSVYQDDFFCEFYGRFCTIATLVSLSFGQLLILIGAFPKIAAQCLFI